MIWRALDNAAGLRLAAIGGIDTGRLQQLPATTSHPIAKLPIETSTACGDGSNVRCSHNEPRLWAQLPWQRQGRRDVLLQALSAAAALGLAQVACPRAAPAGLVQFPANQLRNSYVLIRAGEGACESGNRVCTNPAFKTSMDAGLSDAGRRQVLGEMLPTLRALGVAESGPWIWPSMTQRAYQTAELLAEGLGVGRSRIVPEYSFIDARGVGAMEGGRVDIVQGELARGDASSASWRPPAGSDGTPPESAADVLVRMAQLLSLLETQYSGQTILIIAPDSDCLSVLQAAILGVDLRQHREFGFSLGEARLAQLSEQQPFNEAVQYACPRPPNCT